MKTNIYIITLLTVLWTPVAFTGECNTAGGNEDYLDDDCCDAVNNKIECNWDNGACCDSTCNDYDDLDDGNYTCGVVTAYCDGFTQCIDPGASGNGYCDDSLNNFENNYDSGDCYDAGWYADGYCDPENNFAQIDWDGGDCVNYAWMSDGYCDPANNFDLGDPDFDYDGGDCCKQTCRRDENEDYECGYNGYECHISIKAGDVNDDANIDILDIVSIVQYILGNNTFDDFQRDAGDINCDGGINILDVVGTVGAILNTSALLSCDLGDGFCDTHLNNENDNWDDGDCCFSSCDSDSCRDFNDVENEIELQRWYDCKDPAEVENEGWYTNNQEWHDANMDLVCEEIEIHEDKLLPDDGDWEALQDAVAILEEEVITDYADEEQTFLGAIWSFFEYIADNIHVGQVPPLPQDENGCLINPVSVPTSVAQPCPYGTCFNCCFVNHRACVSYSFTNPEWCACVAKNCQLNCVVDRCCMGCCGLGYKQQNPYDWGAITGGFKGQQDFVDCSGLE